MKRLNLIEVQKSFKLKQIIRQTLIGSGIIFAFAPLFSCSDSDSLSDPSQNLPDKPLVEEEKFNVTVNIPTIGFDGNILGTRADLTDPFTTEESTLHTLYLAVFKQDEEWEEVFHCVDIYNLITADNGEHYPSTYDDKKKLSLYEGTYKFYLLGNVRDYWADGYKAEHSGATDDKVNEEFEALLKAEGYIRDLIIPFMDDKFNGTSGSLAENNLPMGCLAEEVRVLKSSAGSDGSFNESDLEPLENGLFVITENDIANKTTKNVYAPLTFLCSKLRYTVLFDNHNGGFSELFSVADVNFTGNNIQSNTAVRVKNVSNESPFLPYSEDVESPGFYDDNKFTYPMSQVFYPTSDSDPDTSGYLSIEQQENSPANLTSLTQAGIWPNTGQRAWQGGPIYLPENTNYTSGTDPSSAKYTTLHLSPTGTGVKAEGYDINLKNLTRATFYDIVVKMMTPDTFVVTISVKVNPWAYHPNTSVSW